MENIDDNFYKVINSGGLTGPTHVTSEPVGLTGISDKCNGKTKTDPTGPTGYSYSQVNNNGDNCSHKHFLYQ
jgi:hypothetical protein